MTHPVINIEEKIGKTVGRRTVPQDGFILGMQLQETGRSLAKALGLRGIRRGVYRFHSHEDANAWLMSQMVQNAPKS